MTHLFFSPLEQFSIMECIVLFLQLKFLGIFFFFDFSVTIFLIENINNIVFSVIVFFLFISYNFLTVFKSWNILMFYYQFILTIICQQLNNIKFVNVYFPLIITVFLFIFLNNLLGLIPYSFVSTAHLGQNFFLSSSLLIFFTLLGFFYLKLQFIYLFLPTAPLFMLPFLFVIELISYVARAFSLSIWLFANLMSGHTLLYILCAFSSLILSLNFFGFILLSLLIFLIFGLEIVISFMQAYVFTVLVSVYLKDSTFESHH